MGSEKVITVFDVKRTPDKVKNGMQLAAYCKALGYRQEVVVPLNNKTEQKFSKPVVYDEQSLSGYYKMFMQKRKSFTKRYGL